MKILKKMRNWVSDHKTELWMIGVTSLISGFGYVALGRLTADRYPTRRTIDIASDWYKEGYQEAMDLAPKAYDQVFDLGFEEQLKSKASIDNPDSKIEKMYNEDIMSDLKERIMKKSY